MVRKKTPASTKVLKKLSAVRAVLQKDEREVLDAIVLGQVHAHQMPDATPNSTPNNQTKGHQMLKHNKAAARAVAKKQQVVAHSVSRSAARTASRAAAKKQQVVAHSVSRSAAKSAARTAARKQQVVAHSVARSASRAAARTAARKQQVVAHEMPKAPETPVVETTIPQIEFDPTSEQYQPKPEQKAGG